MQVNNRLNYIFNINNRFQLLKTKVPKNLLNKFNIGQEKSNIADVIPEVLVPIVCYMHIKGEKIQNKLQKEIDENKKYFTENYEKSVEQLKDKGVKANYDKYINSNDGRLNQAGKNITSKGAPQDELEYSSSDLSEDYIGNMPEEYDDTADLAEIDELDRAINSLEIALEKGLDFAGDAADILAENPLLVGAVAEITPVTRFVKPVKDLYDGDSKKALIGVATRGVDIVISPLKLAMAIGYGAGKTFDPEYNFSFWKGFKEIYSDWAKVRDDVEDKFIGRETKSEKIKKRINEIKRLKEQKIAEHKRKLEKAQQEKIEFERIREATIAKQKQLQNEVSSIDYSYEDNTTYSELERTQAKFQRLLNEYKELKPNASTQNYDNWYNWNVEKLNKNIKHLRVQINKVKSRY